MMSMYVMCTVPSVGKYSFGTAYMYTWYDGRYPWFSYVCEPCYDYLLLYSKGIGWAWIASKKRTKTWCMDTLNLWNVYVCPQLGIYKHNNPFHPAVFDSITFDYSPLRHQASSIMYAYTNLTKYLLNSKIPSMMCKDTCIIEPLFSDNNNHSGFRLILWNSNSTSFCFWIRVFLLKFHHKPYANTANHTTLVNLSIKDHSNRLDRLKIIGGRSFKWCDAHTHNIQYRRKYWWF